MAHWFDEMSKTQQNEYLAAHPRSRLRRGGNNASVAKKSGGTPKGSARRAKIQILSDANIKAGVNFGLGVASQLAGIPALDAARGGRLPSVKFVAAKPKKPAADHQPKRSAKPTKPKKSGQKLSQSERIDELKGP